MAYREAGDREAPVALFLHGNPTSSYIWRNILPQVAPVAHCIAPDLIGFGQSGKPDIEYRFADHVRYLDAFLDHAGISSAFVIAQDWGTALAFHLAARRPEFIRGLAFMEFIANAYLEGFSPGCNRDLPEVQDARGGRRNDS
jgi:haloalkane dehalogenase